MTGWIGYFAPRGTPQLIVERLAKALAAICREPEVVKAMANAGIDSVGNTPDEFAAFIQSDLPVMRAAVEAAGLLSK
jgi:tripartite-type tricarboxylate transporter receptor subunit TctC